MDDPAKSIKDRNGYYIMLILTVIVAGLSLYIRELESFYIALPTAAILLHALWKRGGAYIPPALVLVMAVVMILLEITRYGARDEHLLSSISDFMMGLFFTLVGLIMVYAMLKESPGYEGEKPAFIALDAFCNAVTLTLGVMMAGMYTEYWFMGYPLPGLEDVSERICLVSLGAFSTAVLFYLDRRNGALGYIINRFLSGNADVIGIPERDRESVLKDVAGGETSKVEFKSTLRTNLKTGEKDPRIEKAVLKTIVAFLNSRGGTLYIGVADDGEIVGIDLESFDSRDKLNLHMNNLLTRDIGSEFLPYITYDLVDFGEGKAVMRVRCDRSEVPAFLVEKNEKTFYVRSGPSSISLKGMELLYYANHNFGKALKRPKNRA